MQPTPLLAVGVRRTGGVSCESTFTAGGVEASVHGWSVDFTPRSGHADRKQNKTLGRETP